MLGLYGRSQNEDGTFNFECVDNEVSLGGSNTGIICRELRKMLKPESNAPMGWKILFADLLSGRDYSILIDMKPGSKDQTFICELDTVFGFSYEESSTVMFRLKQIVNQEREENFDPYDFSYTEANLGFIYSMNNMAGSFMDGKLSGPWTFPNKTATDALLLRPAALTYFFQQIKEADPGFLKEKIKILEL